MKRLAAILLFVSVLTLVIALIAANAGDVMLHSSGRYYQDASGKPMFLIGYYGWAAVPDGYFIDHPSRYSVMITSGAPYKINYIRISLGVNRMTNATNPPSWNGVPTPVPFLYVNGKADLNQWDPVFWNGLKAQCQLAKDNGVITHIAIFDGVEIRSQGGESYGYANSFWKPSNQTSSFYPNPDFNGNGQIDDSGEFYQLSNFNNNTGIGYYQKRLIDKACAELASYDNVFFEVGNELMGSDSAWNTAVISYIKTKTSKLITQENNGGSYNRGTGLQGWVQHNADTPAQVKSNVASIVGAGYPAWEDPDGPALSDGNVSPDDLRRAAWYSFVGGAACWGGFTVDYWAGGRGFWIPTATYYKNLQQFIQDSGVQFWNMTPQHVLVSNSGTNSCLAARGSQYVAYILSDSSATLDLSDVSGNIGYQLYDPKAGTYSELQSVAGGGTRTFTKPAGASDWVIYVSDSLIPPSKTLYIKPAGAITIDGDSSDWNLSEFTTPIRGGQAGAGDYALIGFDGGTLYYGAYAPGNALPISAADHNARVYSRQDSTYQFFLVRCDDDDIQYPSALDMNWSNDCVEFYLDPSHDGGSNSIADSTSDIQLVIDANNQKNVYMCTDTYKNQVLAGVTSAVVRDATGWWLEVRIAKSALDPDLPSTATYGIDFNFRDNDNNNNTALTTVYTWNDNDTNGSFPSKIPNNWGDTRQPSQPYNGVIAMPGTIQAENYDNGGEGIAYHDISPTNLGGAYRSDDVDIEPCADTGGEYSVGYIDTGEWLAYTVNVATAGNYDIRMRVASPNDGCSFHIEMNGHDVTGVKSISNTGGWQTWTTITVPGVTLSPGQQILKVVVDSGGWNFNYIDVANAVLPPVNWNTLGTIKTIASGSTPGIASDSQGNIHVVYMSGSRIYYKKYDINLQSILSEEIPVPGGVTGDYNCPHIVCDGNNVPHLTFEKDYFSTSKKAWYTNRIGGSWRSPVEAINSSVRLNYPRLALSGSYAYIGAIVNAPDNSPNIGKIVRLTNLSGTPTVDRSVDLLTWGYPTATSNGHIFVIGRYQANGHYLQEYDANLTPIGAFQQISLGKYGKTTEPTAIGTTQDDVAYAIGCNIRANLPGEQGYDNNQFFYNTVNRARASQSCVFGLNGPDRAGESGWFGEEVYPVTIVDSTGRIYVAYREFLSGLGRVSIIDGSQFATPVTFTPDIYQRMRWNASITPAVNGGVYVAWESGGQCYFRGVGVGSGVVIPDNDPPDPVTNFTATPANGQNTLSWTNPITSDFTGTMIRYKTTGYPTSATDGTLVIDKSGTASATDTYTHTGLTNGTTYYYSAFAHDYKPNYAGAVQVSATPLSTYPCFTEPFNYANGNLVGNGGWTGSATTQIQVSSSSVKFNGGTGDADAIHNVVCSGDGTSVGVSAKVRAGFGTSTLWSMYIDDPQNRNLARFYGSAATARGRIGDGGTVTPENNLTGNWDDIYVKINFITNMSDFYLNGVLMGSLSHAETSAGDSIGRIRLFRNDSAVTANNYFFLDSISVGPVDVTAPVAAISAPSVSTIKTGTVRYTVTFSEAVIGFAAADIQVNKTGSVTSGSVSITGSNPYTVSIASVNGNGTISISVKASAVLDAAGNANALTTAADRCVVIASDGSLAAAKTASENSVVTIGNKILYYKNGTVGYIEEEDRFAGLRIEGSILPAIDNKVSFSGTIKTNAAGERYVLLDGIASLGAGSIGALGTNNRAAKSSVMDGLLVTVWGSVVPGSITANSFVITDGSDADGIKVITTGSPGVNPDTFVTVTGAAGKENGNRVIYRK